MKSVDVNSVGNFDTWDNAILRELKQNKIEDNLGQRLLFENDTLKVWEAVLQPNERLPFRRVVKDHCWVSMTDALAISRSSNGEIKLLRLKRGDSVYMAYEGESYVYDLENIGEKMLFFHLMEFKPMAMESNTDDVDDLLDMYT